MSQTLDSKELWRQVPPEEKLELLSRAHSTGTLSALSLIICGGTIAIGLQVEWFLWGAFALAPMAFQVAAGRAWRAIRPRVMLEYLGARSAARRFAFTAKAKDLTLRLAFRGTMEEVFAEDNVTEKLEAVVEKTQQVDVWIALFTDAVVMLSERTGGAEAEFAQAISNKLKVEVNNTASGGSDYAEGKEIYLSYQSRMMGVRKVKLTSRYPAALVVFEKALQRRLSEIDELAKLAPAEEVAELPEP